jgi:hypothetical protein
MQPAPQAGRPRGGTPPKPAGITYRSIDGSGNNLTNNGAGEGC